VRDGDRPDRAPASVRLVAQRAGEFVVLGSVAVLVLIALLSIAGFAPGPAIRSLWTGAFGSADAVLSATLVRAVPLMLIGSGMVIALRTGVINLGGDGQLLAGAVAATSIALWWEASGGFLAITAALTVAAVAGAAWTLIPVWLKARFGTLEVVSTIMMNFVAAYLVSYLVRGPLQEPTRIYPQSSPIPFANQLPVLVDGARLHAGIGLALAAAIAAWLILEHSAAGFRMRAVGSNARAAELAGRIDVRGVQMRAFLASGALAGLAGGVEVLGVTFALYENLSPGYGYSAIAVALLARLGPLRAIWSAVLLGALAAGATAMQRDAGIPAGAAATVEAALILAVLGGQALVLRWGSWHPWRRSST
jgi:simple sugar transport system permease protein